MINLAASLPTEASMAAALGINVNLCDTKADGKKW